MSSSYGGSSEAVNARIHRVLKTFRELGGVLFRKQGLPLKQCGKIYQSCVRLVLLYCSEILELTVADELGLGGMKRYRQLERCVG